MKMMGWVRGLLRQLAWWMARAKAWGWVRGLPSSRQLGWGMVSLRICIIMYACIYICIYTTHGWSRQCARVAGIQRVRTHAHAGSIQQATAMQWLSRRSMCKVHAAASICASGSTGKSNLPGSGIGEVLYEDGLGEY